MGFFSALAGLACPRHYPQENAICSDGCVLPLTNSLTRYSLVRLPNPLSLRSV